MSTQTWHKAELASRRRCVSQGDGHDQPRTCRHFRTELGTLSRRAAYCRTDVSVLVNGSLGD